VNSPPGYYWHYRKRDGSLPLGVIVLKQLLADHRAGRGPAVSVTIHPNVTQTLSEVCT
jgi:hypothetical protein